MERRVDSDGRLAADNVIDADEGDVGAHWRLVQLARAEVGGRAVVDYAMAGSEIRDPCGLHGPSPWVIAPYRLGSVPERGRDGTQDDDEPRPWHPRCSEARNTAR